VLGLTAIGRAGERVPSRSGGEAGDALWLVGTLGDAALGLAQLRDDPKAAGPMVDSYRRPVPQIAAGSGLARHAHAMMDVSDGLLLDARRMAEASACRAHLDLDALPLSSAFIEARGESRLARLFAATAGDDYALLAALPSDLDASTLSLPSRTRIERIGRLEAGRPDVRLVSKGKPIELPERLGYEHRGLAASTMADRP
jgi:thiamine-monophosphate kinase